MTFASVTSRSRSICSRWQPCRPDVPHLRACGQGAPEAAPRCQGERSLCTSRPSFMLRVIVDSAGDMHPALGSQRESVSARVSLHATAGEILRRKSSKSRNVWMAPRGQGKPTLCSSRSGERSLFTNPAACGWRHAIRGYRPCAARGPGNDIYSRTP